MKKKNVEMTEVQKQEMVANYHDKKKSQSYILLFCISQELTAGNTTHIMQFLLEI